MHAWEGCQNTDPEFIGGIGEAAKQRRGAFLDDREIVVDNNFSHTAIEVHLDDVLARRTQHRHSIFLREYIA